MVNEREFCMKRGKLLTVVSKEYLVLDDTLLD